MPCGQVKYVDPCLPLLPSVHPASLKKKDSKYMVKTSFESIEITKWSENEHLKNTRQLKKADGSKVKQKITLLAFIHMATMLMNTMVLVNLVSSIVQIFLTSLRDRKSEKCQEWALFTRVLIYHFLFPVSYPLHLTLTFTICSFL